MVLDHLSTADNNFINYASYLVLQWKDPAYLVKNFGYEKWYEHNLKEQYRTIVRDVTKKYPMTAIMTDPPTLAAIKRYSEACKESKSCVIVQGNAPVLVGGR